MSSRGRTGSIALLVSFAAAGLSACNDDAGGDGDGDDAATGGVLFGGSTASGGGSGRGGASPSGGTTSGGGTGLATGSGGGNSTGGATAKGGSTATGGAAANAGRSGSTNEGGVPSGPGDDSPYETECHGDTVMCGEPTKLLCLGIRVGTEVFGYSCSNECESEADCSDKPASGEAAAGCVEFVNKKYCLLVCKNGEEQASCPTGMYCYVYEGTPTGYCLWR
jgi:hypothetical protein